MGVASCQRECACQAPIWPSRCSSSREAWLLLPHWCYMRAVRHLSGSIGNGNDTPKSPSIPLSVCFAFWLMDFRNQLSMAAWFVLRAGYLFLRTAKCHRLCGDSINQSPRIINNQRERAREREQHWALPWPDTSCPARWRFWKIANQRNRKEFRTLQLTSTSIRAMCQKQRKFLDCCYCCSPPPLPSPLWNFDELHGELCSDNCPCPCPCPCQWQIVLLLSFAKALNCSDCWLTRFHLMLSLEFIRCANLCRTLE